MRSIIFSLSLLFLSSNLFASELTYMEISTVTYRTIFVTTGTTIQVDNFDGEGEGLMSLRNEILVQNLDSANSIFCAYDTNVTTTTIIGSKAGKEITPGGVVNISIGPSISYHCQAADAAGTSAIPVHIEQASWRFP